MYAPHETNRLEIEATGWLFIFKSPEIKTKTNRLNIFSQMLEKKKEVILFSISNEINTSTNRLHAFVHAEQISWRKQGSEFSITDEIKTQANHLHAYFTCSKCAERVVGWDASLAPGSCKTRMSLTSGQKQQSVSTSPTSRPAPSRWAVVRRVKGCQVWL